MEQNQRMLMKQEGTKDRLRLLRWAVVTMNSQQSSSTGYAPRKLDPWGTSCVVFPNPLPC